MDKSVFAHLLEIQAIFICMVMLISCNPIPPNATSTPTPYTRSLTPSQRLSSSLTPTNVSATPTITRRVNNQEPTEIVPSTPTKRPTQISKTMTPDINLKDKISSDLLFISKGSLVGWDSEDGSIKPIIQVPPNDTDAEFTHDQAIPPGSILKYSVDQRSRFIALLRSKGISANGVELFDLALLDVENEEFIILIEEMPRINQLSLSPDGRWIAYTTSEETGRIYAIRTEGIGEPREIGHYSVDKDWEYGQIRWSPDGRKVIWSDASGLWITNPDDPNPQQILSDVIEIRDLQGEKSNIRVMFPSMDWSPIGRFILTLVQPYQSTVKWQGIIDTRRGLIAEVPGTYEYRNPAANAKWGKNGDLIVATGNDVEEALIPSLEIFRVVSTRDDMVIRKEEIPFHPEQFVGITGDSEYNNKFLLDVPTQIDKWKLSFIIKSLESVKQPTLFIFDKKSGSLSAVSEIPFDTISVDWSPNGEDAILRGHHGSVLLILAEEGKVIDIGTAWELDPCCVNWLPIDIGKKWKDHTIGIEID